MSDNKSTESTSVGLPTAEPTAVSPATQQTTRPTPQSEPHEGEPDKQEPLLELVRVPVFDMDASTVIFDLEVKDSASSSCRHSDGETSFSPDVSSLFRVDIPDIRSDIGSTSRSEERDDTRTAPDPKN